MRGCERDIVMRLSDFPLSLHRSIAVVAMLVVAMLTSLDAWADYSLSSGDKLELTVFGRPDLNRRATIDIDGNIIFPLIGEVKARGLSLPELRAQIRNQLEASNSVRGSDVILELVETQPFYIHGDVARSGAYPFYNGLTVRHAIALAGGLDAARGKTNATPRDISDLKGRYNQAAREAARFQIRVAILQAELSNSVEIDASVKNQTSKGKLQEIFEAEFQNLKNRVSERKKEQDYLKSALKLADDEVAALERSQQQDAEARKQQVAEMERVAELSSKGLAASGRVTEEQRATVLLKGREMDTAARLALARRQREEVLWRISKADERRLVVLEELNTAVAGLAEAKGQVESLGEQLTLMGAGDILSSSGKGLDLDIQIFRNDAQKEGMQADQDAQLNPGDVIEVRQHSMEGNKGL